MKIKLELNIDEYTINDAYDRMCEEYECCDCTFYHMPTEIDKYKNCKEKYVATRFKNDIEYEISQMFR